MPGFDGTGPLGQGSRTGRGLGYCTPGVGFGRGFGRGLGRGLRRGYGAGYGYGVPQRDLISERQYLEERALYLEDLKTDLDGELSEIKAMLQEQKAVEKKD
ncbi:MAG: DUF5320 domain-containing protein [Clostridia bacterium]|jgi:hypothetical protein|nr:DUF5320 domain-containing protein [Clostridia bacterium]